METLNPSQPNARLRYEYDRGTGYETELRLTEALAALVPGDELVHQDHRLFQLVHLITEYAWVGIHDAMCILDTALAKDDLVGATRALSRGAALAGLPVTCVRLLTDSLPQETFLQLRAMFAEGASGLDSPGARGMRKAGLAVWDSFESTLAAHGVSLDDLAEASASGFTGEPRLALLADVMLHMYRFDARILEWKQVHLGLVWQMLGGHPATGDTPPAAEDRPRSMRGRPISDLERLAVRPLFPKLWQHSTERYRVAAGGAGLAYRAS
ncbi:hypothetical protein KZZ52_26205 [Dactylosporangium sp. AC04546]|uniref:hypothetical protein n=1 Tax=Dactylosporangium sp. AC04546 TaxID=2862460 RepID=UPI001EDD6D01|nr:hypothetical protein [Dactylosporangium sp. AC04546]WVK88765.1 hypothetical protein KZZ52_26205 [Dactylosporangium sp. AC04546]